MGNFSECYMVFAIITIVVLGAMIYFYSRIPVQKKFLLLRFTIILLAAGAIGNFIDRMMWHYVVDFLYIKAINFPVFNVADCYVCVAAVLLIYCLLFRYKEEDFFVEEEKLIIDVETEEERRIDQFLADQMEYSRSFIQKLIKNERVTVNGNVITKVKYPVSFRDKIIIEIPAPTELEIKPEKMDLDILYEDNDVIVIDKPKGMVVHPSAGHMSHTLVNGLCITVKEICRE